MEKLYFKIEINAPKEKVWDVLLGETTYPQWTVVFSEGSRAITDWKKGSRTLFVNAEGDGMISTIAEHIPNEYLSIKHLGFYMKGVEDYDSEQAKKWGGAFENYKISQLDGKSVFSVETDTIGEYKSFFENVWPKALALLKDLSEA